LVTWDFLGRIYPRRRRPHTNQRCMLLQTDAIKRKRDKEISACFERARENLNSLLRSKKHVIRDLAHELERLGRPVDHIAAEIVHELRNCEELSKSQIYSYLYDKYKDQTQAQRRNGKKKESNANTAKTDYYSWQ